MISRTYSIAFSGINPILVDIQVSITKGLPSFSIVGLADKAVSESKDRLRSALISMGLVLPASKITVNLSPADLIKEGSYFDLPIALAILGAMDVIPKEDIINYVSMGELSLDGSLVEVSGVLAGGLFATNSSKGFIFPKQQESEVSLISQDMEALAAKDLLEIVSHFKYGNVIKSHLPDITQLYNTKDDRFIDISEIKGHESAKYALEVAAAGGHNLLMIGSPGSGKSMLASAFGSILPPLTQKEILDCSLIYSIAGAIKDRSLITLRPYRAPHHSASLAAIVGGGSKAKPGEITLAHNGVLFLDEFAEFNKNILDALRQPLETKEVSIARVKCHVVYPADFQLIAAMNPCRCGYFGIKDRHCSKAPICAENYQSKISGPIMDRIDLVIEVEPVPLSDLNINTDTLETSASVKERVIVARDIQEERYRNYNIITNSQASAKILEETANLELSSRELLQKSADKLGLSTRAYFRVLKVARTIADLESEKSIKCSHIATAISFRSMVYSKKY